MYYNKITAITTNENTALSHCNLVITIILGAKRNERYNEMHVIMKCTF